MTTRQTNREFAAKDEGFRTAYAKKFGPYKPPTARQASKYRRGYGRARGLTRMGSKIAR